MELPDLAQWETTSTRVELVDNSTTIQCNNKKYQKNLQSGVHYIYKATKNISMSTGRAKSNEPRRKNDPDPAKNANL